VFSHGSAFLIDDPAGNLWQVSVEEFAERPLADEADAGRVLLRRIRQADLGGLKERGAARGASEHAPWFVARKDVDRNTLYIVQGHDHPWLQADALVADDASWIAGVAPAPGRCAAKTRYRQADAACRAAFVGAGGSLALRFDAPQWAVTPGQSAVLYDGEVCLGGAVIASASMTEPAPVAA